MLIVSSKFSSDGSLSEGAASSDNADGCELMCGVMQRARQKQSLRRIAVARLSDRGRRRFGMVERYVVSINRDGNIEVVRLDEKQKGRSDGR